MSISNLAAQYNKFQTEFGAGQDLNYEEKIKLLFTPAFKKIANGKEITSDRSQLYDQLCSVKDSAGNWSITEKEIISSSDNKKCTISYIIKTEKIGVFEVIAILSSPDSKKIHNIYEVYYQVL